VGKVSQAKQSLEQRGLIVIAEQAAPGGISHHITIADIWRENHERYSVHQVNASDSVQDVNAKNGRVQDVNAMRSPGEPKNIPSKNTTEHEEDGEGEGAQVRPPDCLPNQFDLSVKAIKKMKFRRAEYFAILEAEQGREKPRSTLIDHIESKLSVNQHPAVAIFREQTHYYPRGEWRQKVADTVGEQPVALDLWERVCEGWVGIGWNVLNTKGMLDYWARGEIPGEDRPEKQPTGDNAFEEFERLTGLRQVQRVEENVTYVDA